METEEDPSTNASACSSNRMDSSRFRSMRSMTPAPNDTQASNSHETSFAKILSFASNFTPSILANVWYKKKINDATMTTNGSNRLDVQRILSRKDDTKHHILGLDAYLSNDEDSDHESDDAAKIRMHQFRHPLGISEASSSAVLNAIHQAPKRSHPIEDTSDYFGISKRSRITREQTSTQDSYKDVRPTAAHTQGSSRSRHRFWTSNESATTPAQPPSRIPAPVTTSARPASVIITPPTPSRSPSQASIREREQLRNIFSVAPKSQSRFARFAAASRTPSALSHSRTSSATSNPPSSIGYDFGSVLGYNSETRHILRDLERVIDWAKQDVNRSSKSTRCVVNGPVADPSSKQRITRPSSAISSNASDDNEPPRLAMLGPNFMHKSFKAHSLFPQQQGSQNGHSAKTKAGSIVPKSVVSSAKVYRFARPMPIAPENDSETNGPYRFGSTPLSMVIGHSSTSSGNPSDVSQLGRNLFMNPSFHRD